MILDFLNQKLREPATGIIEIDNQEINDLYGFLTELVVETSRTEAAAATLTFETRRLETGEWVIQDDGRFYPWAKIKILAAFGSESEEIMRGYIREIQAEYPNEAGTTKVTVTCQDDSIALDREHLRDTWGGDSPTTDRVIVETILHHHGLTLHRDSQDGMSHLTLHQNSTDIRFLNKRAQANGYELIFRNGEVYFGPMRVAAEAQDNIMVYAGPDTNCINISIQDDGHKPDSVAFDIAAETGAGTNTQVIQPNLPTMGTTAADSRSTGLRDFTWRMDKQGVCNATEITARAQQLANEQAMRVRANGELDGSLYGHVLRVAEPVGVDGVGERYGGIYYVDTVTHRFDMNGYRQTFTLMRNAYGDNLTSSRNPLARLI
jgi:phage protein D